MALRWILFALLMALFPAGAGAQNLGQVVSPILTLDRDRLFSESAYGTRVNSELEAENARMAAETRKIEAALEEEEQSLTEQRATLEPEAFRELAEAFDEKVQALRAERAEAESNLRARIEAEQTAFFSRIGPVLGQLVRQRGAILIVDRRAILLAAADVDITDEAIARIDAVLGDGGSTDDTDDADAGDDSGTEDEAVPIDTISPAPEEETGETTATPETGQ